MRAAVVCCAAVALLAVAFGPNGAFGARCLTPKTASVSGGPVSWWMGFKVVSKLPQDSQEFVWISSQHKTGQWEVATTATGPLATTLNQLNAKDNHSALRYIKWNDQIPPNAVSNPLHPKGVEPGHSKGVLASHYTRAFYLSHSWPQFPDPGSAYGYSSKQSRPDAISQDFFCFSLDLTGETPEKLMNHFGLVRPGIYDSYPSNIATVDPAWSLITSYPLSDKPQLTNYMAKDVLPLIADAALQKEGALPASAPANKVTTPTGTACGGGASCLARRAAAAGKSASGAPTFSAGSVQLFASSETNMPGTFWSAFRKWVFPNRPFTVQTWVSAAHEPNEQLNENLFLSGPLKTSIMSFACFPPNAASGDTGMDARCVLRRELHSKVAVSQSPSFPVTCFADVNMEQTRSGGMVCLQSESVRSIVADHVYPALGGKDAPAGTGALPPAVAFARVDSCVSATAAACTANAVVVESLAAAYAAAEAHPLAQSPVKAAPSTTAKPPANNPLYVDAPCSLNPNPCPAFPNTSKGNAAPAPVGEEDAAPSKGKAKAKAKTSAKTTDAKTKAKAKVKTKPIAKPPSKATTKKRVKNQKAML